MNKKNMYIVIKQDDIKKYLTDAGIQSLQNILLIIEQGRKRDGKQPSNTYYVCNTDEPYAKNIHEAIVIGEIVKTQNNFAYCPDACGTSCNECFEEG